MPTIEYVNQQPKAKPDYEAKPGDDRQPGHQADAEDDRDQRKPWNKRDSERSPAIRLPPAQDDHSQGNQNKGKQRADVGEVGGISDVHETGGNSYSETGDPGGPVGRLIFR